MVEDSTQIVVRIWRAGRWVANKFGALVHLVTHERVLDIVSFAQWADSVFSDLLLDRV